MNEGRMARQMGVIDNSVILTVRSSSDPRYYELGRELKRRVKRGDIVVFDATGNASVIDREEARRQSIHQAAQRSEAIAVRAEEPALRVVDAIGTNPIAAKLAAGLNGDEARARRLFLNKAKEFKRTGAISQTETIRHTDSSRQPVFGVQSGEPNPERRVKAYFSREGEDFVLRVLCKVIEDERGRDALREDGFIPPRIGKGAKRKG